MKKLIPIVLVSMFTMSSIALACDSDCADYNAVKYTTQAETTLKSNSILVQVTGYATTTLKEQNSIEQQISSKINNIVKSDWKIKNLEQNTSKSGALNITVQLQSRISPKELNILQSSLENQSNLSSQKLIVQVLDYNPPISEVESAKQDLMIKIYKNTKQYLDNFNRQTNSSYTIQSIKYIDVNNYSPSNNIMLMKTTSNTMDSNGQTPVAVSQDINIKANVTFMEK